MEKLNNQAPDPRDEETELRKATEVHELISNGTETWIWGPQFLLHPGNQVRNGHVAGDNFLQGVHVHTGMHALRTLLFLLKLLSPFVKGVQGLVGEGKRRAKR